MLHRDSWQCIKVNSDTPRWVLLEAGSYPLRPQHPAPVAWPPLCQTCPGDLAKLKIKQAETTKTKCRSNAVYLRRHQGTPIFWQQACLFNVTASPQPPSIAWLVDEAQLEWQSKEERSKSADIEDVASQQAIGRSFANHVRVQEPLHIR